GGRVQERGDEKKCQAGRLHLGDPSESEFLGQRSYTDHGSQRPLTLFFASPAEALETQKLRQRRKIKSKYSPKCQPIGWRAGARWNQGSGARNQESAVAAWHRTLGNDLGVLLFQRI